MQKLRRIAVRATKKADWHMELAEQMKEFEGYEVDPDEQAKLRQKAMLALQACCYLNVEHSLGY